MKTSLIAGALLLGILALPASAAGQTARSADAAAAPSYRLAARAQSFDDWVTVTLADKVKADPKYRRIPLDTKPAAEEFGAWMLELWSQQITADEFKRRVDRKYPGHEYEVYFIIANMPLVSERRMH